jgi:hypothetical protein
LKIRRLAVAGVAVFAAAGLLAGCGAKNGTDAAASPTAKASPSPTLAPKDALLASTKSLATTSYKFTIKSDSLNGTGSADPVKKAVTLQAVGQEQGVSVKLDFIAISPDLYAKLDLGGLNSQLGIQSDKYMHVDATKLGANPSLPIGIDGDPAHVAGILAGLNNVQTTDGKTFTGTVDATKMTGDSAPDSDAIQKAGDKAKAIPFTAVLDDQGRLTDLKVDGASIDPKLAFEATFAGYGSVADITKPDASQVVEAPDSVLQLFKS